MHVYHWGTKILCLGSLKSSKPIVKGFYLAPQILLAIFCDRKLSDFQEIHDSIVYENNSGGFWCNMASEQYKKFVTDTEISADVDLGKAIDVLREEGSDGCLYCSDCIHDHLEDEEEIA